MSFARPDIEKAILGNILMHPELLSETVDLAPGDFSHSSNWRIFFRLREMSRGGAHIDLLTVKNALDSNGELEGVNGPAYVTSLLDGIVERASVKAYVEIIKGCSLRRRLMRELEQARSLAENPSVPIDDCVLSVEKVSALLRNDVRAERKLNFQTAAEITAAAEPGTKVKWVVRPWVAAESMTILSGKVKSAGKTTLVMGMVSALLHSRPFLGELATTTPVVYLTEQPRASFREALQRAELSERKDLLVLPWDNAAGLSWPDLVTGAIGKCKAIGAELLIVDTLHQFAQLRGDSENNAGDALAAIRPLQQATAHGLAVLIVVHERKSGGEVADSGRGSSAFAGAVDIVMQLRRLEGNGRPTLRQIQAVSRFSDTPAKLVIELTDSGYISHGEARDVKTREAKAKVIHVAPGSETEAMSLDEFVDSTGIARSTAQRVINILIDERRLKRVGEGKRGNGFRFFAPEILSAQTVSIKGQEETEDDWAPRPRNVVDPASPCPLCGESTWWSSPDGTRVCRACHPNPQDAEQSLVQVSDCN